VYFALLGAPGRDIAAFPPHDVDEGFLFYQHRGGIWSVAHITRHEPKDEVLMFDGISSLAPPTHDDKEWRIRYGEQRNERIDCLTDVVKTWLKGMSRCINIPFWDSGKFSDRDSTLSGTLCLAWAEARLKNWPTYLTWREDRMEAAWVPTTDDSNEEAEMSEDGGYHWKHVLWLRAHKARFDKLAKHNGGD
jgi:hypothetical protein